MACSLENIDQTGNTFDTSQSDFIVNTKLYSNYFCSNQRRKYGAHKAAVHEANTQCKLHTAIIRPVVHTAIRLVVGTAITR